MESITGGTKTLGLLGIVLGEWVLETVDDLNQIAAKGIVSHPEVSIVILNWNNVPDTLTCLESVFRLQYDNFDVVVVDNGSTDGSADRIRAAYPAVNLIEIGDNLGYAEGNNVGIHWALAHGADYVFILNNDTVVATDSLSRLIWVAETDSAIGILGPTMYCVPTTNTLFALGSMIKWAKGSLVHRGMFQPLSVVRLPSVPEPVDFIIGCAVLIRRNCIETIGYFNPSYYLNFEDVEWGVLAQRNGYRVLHVPDAAIWHKVSATLGQASPANTYYMTRNSLSFFWRNAPKHLRLLAVSRILMRTCRTIAAWSIRREYRLETFRCKRDANLLAIRDFFLGRFGKMGSDVARICYGSE